MISLAIPTSRRTRSPCCIAEAIEPQGQEPTEAGSVVEEAEPTGTEPTTANGEPKLTNISAEVLQQHCTKVVSCDTGSSDQREHIWRTRDARKGRIKTGSVRRRDADGKAPDVKVLPLRMEAEIIASLNQAHERLGLKARIDFFRESLADDPATAGEHETTQFYNPQT